MNPFGNHRVLFTPGIAALCLFASQKAITEVNIRFAILDQYVRYRMTVTNGPQKEWTVEGPEHWAYALPRRRMVISGSGFNGIVIARSYTGHLLWTILSEFPGELESYIDAVICDDVLLLLGRGPTAGVSMGYVEVFSDMERRHQIAAYSMRTGRLLWRSTRYAMGWPVWATKNSIVNETVDASRKSIRRYNRTKRPLPVYLEIWGVSPRRRLWRKSIPGHLPPLVRIAPVGRKMTRLYFKWEDYESDDHGYLRQLPQFSINVPIASDEQIPAAAMPRLFKVNHDSSIY